MRKILVGIVLSLCFAVVATLPLSKVNAAPVEVSTEQELVDAILVGGEITLTSNIDITKPIVVNEDTTITSSDSNNYVLDGTNMTLNGKNGSILAAFKNLTLKNVTLSNALKYGVQAYNGGNVTLDNVTINNCKYGAVLINGGQLRIKGLNINNNTAGIEFAKGENVNGDPALIMDGTLKSTNQNNAITVDDTQVEKFIVKNEDSSSNKIELKDNYMVVNDKNGNTMVKSETLAPGLKVEINGVEEVTKEPVVTTTTNTTITTQTPEKNPNTSDNVSLYVLGLLAGICGIGLCVKKLVK